VTTLSSELARPTTASFRTASNELRIATVSVGMTSPSCSPERAPSRLKPPALDGAIACEDAVKVKKSEGWVDATRLELFHGHPPHVDAWREDERASFLSPKSPLMFSRGQIRWADERRSAYSCSKMGAKQVLIASGSVSESLSVGYGRRSLIAPRTEPYERIYRIRLPPWMSDEECCCSYTTQSLVHSITPYGQKTQPS
jgi:hypothetical protein